MIQPITYGGCRWKVTFRYTPTKGACAGQGGPNITHCVIYADVVGGHKLEGWAYRSAADKPSYEIGRKVALTRALEGADKAFRTAIWAAYLGRTRRRPTQQDEWAQGMVRLRDQIRQLEWRAEDLEATIKRLKQAGPEGKGDTNGK